MFAILLKVKNKTTKDNKMTATGTFEVNLEPQEDQATPAGRMLINKIYSGALVGTGIGQMISKRTENGASVYYAIEEFSGSVDGQSGALTLVHNGFMDKDSHTLDIQILPGSASGELANITGSMTITQEDGVHAYELNYQL
jgi:hypothetical protein